jgi:phosphocarrier protein FPr
MVVSAAPVTPDATIVLGRPGAPGIGRGRALLLAAPATPPERDLAREPVDSDEESARLRRALETAADQLNELAERITASAGEDVGAIFAAQALFARDPGIVEPALAEIAGGSLAADAILSVTAHHADRLAAVDDDYFRERAADVRDIGRRVAGIVLGNAPTDTWRPDGQPAILVAQDLDPSVVATLRPELVAGIVLDRGSATSHATIVARALGIPLVLGVTDATLIVPPDADVAVDGSGGRVLIDPDAEALRSLLAVAVPPAPSSAPGGASHEVTVAANVASAREASLATEAGADGIGLVRTELVFLGRHRPPSVAEQRATYSRIVEAAAGRPVVFRTLDVGGDKPASWQATPMEANPALGVRGVRLGMRDPGTLDDQLRALIAATAGVELQVMLPMISTLEELESVRGRVEAIASEVRATGGTEPRSIRLGVMIEVPAAALMAEALAEVADFFSIGTNDLVQYTMAADRTNPELAELASPLQPAVLRLIDAVVRAAQAHGKHVTVCGEAAADAEMIPVLVGLGVEELSVTPSAIGRVRAVLVELDPAACRQIAGRALASRSLAEVREAVAASR